MDFNGNENRNVERMRIIEEKNGKTLDFLNKRSLKRRDLNVGHSPHMAFRVPEI